MSTAGVCEWGTPTTLLQNVCYSTMSLLERRPRGGPICQKMRLTPFFLLPQLLWSDAEQPCMQFWSLPNRWSCWHTCVEHINRWKANRGLPQLTEGGQQRIIEHIQEQWLLSYSILQRATHSLCTFMPLNMVQFDNADWQQMQIDISVMEAVIHRGRWKLISFSISRMFDIANFNCR